jgi:hypothetical protein
MVRNQIARRARPEGGIMATLTAHVDLIVGDHTVRDARAVTLAAVAAWGCEVPIEALLLLVDELAGAVRDHAGEEHSVVLALSAHDAQGIRVTLADGAAVRATAADVVRGAPGLAGLLESLAARWGDEPLQGGYSIWFEVAPVEPGTIGPALRPDEPGLGLAVELGVEADLQRERAARRSELPAVDASSATRLDAWFGACGRHGR